jgi:hypothetical protein
LSGWGLLERYIEGDVVHSSAVETLAAWPGLAAVRVLKLSENEVGRAGLRALVSSPHGRSLKELALRSSRLVDEEALLELLDTLSGPRLDTLDLGENTLTRDSITCLASAPCLRELKSLWLDRCDIPHTASAVLAEAVFLSGLRLLDVSHNHFGANGLAELLKRQPPLLHTLRIRDNDLFDKGVTLLAESPASNTLLELDLSQNGLGNGLGNAVEALGASEHLRELLILHLDAPCTKPPGADGIAPRF